MIEEMVSIVGEVHYVDDPEILATYAKDHSFVPERAPLAIVRPQNTDQIRHIVEVANKIRISLIPLSSGPPRFHGDTIPTCPGIIVDLSDLDSVFRVDRRNRVAMVEPGVTFDKLRKALDSEGLKPYTPLLPRSTKSVLTSALEREPITIPKDHWDFLDPIAGGQVIIGDGHVQGFGDTAEFSREEVESGQTPVYPVGPSNIGWLSMIQGSQGTLGIVPWGVLRCRIKPLIQRPLFISGDDLQGLVPFYQRIMKPRFVDELFIINAFGLATLMAEQPSEIDRIRSLLPRWVVFVNITGSGRYPDEALAWKQERLRDFAEREGLALQEAVGDVGANSLLRILDQTATTDRRIRYKESCAVIPFETTSEKTPKLFDVITSTTAFHGYPPSETSIYIQPIIQGCQCQGEIVFPYDPGDKTEASNVKNLFLDSAQKLRSAGAYYSKPYSVLAEMTYNDPGIAKICRIVKDVLDPHDVMHSGRLF